MGDQQDDDIDLDEEEQQPNGAAPAGLHSTAILRGLRFQPPESFDGTEAKFEFFSMKLKSYLCLGDKKYENYLDRAERATAALNWNVMTDEEQEYASVLQHVLINLCSGTALRIVERNRQTANGFESWRLLVHRFGTHQRTKGISRIQRILCWKFRSTYQNFENDLNEWELEIQRFDIEQTTPLADNIKI